MKSSSLLDRIYVASPCAANWDGMPGDERARFCSQCNLYVYNISAMSAAEAESLFAKTEGRLCVRLFRRADGTVLTRDCPVGLRLWRRRLARGAGAALTALSSLFGGFEVAARPTLSQGQSVVQPQFKIKRIKHEGKNLQSVLSGTIYDVNNAVIYGAHVKLIREGEENAPERAKKTDTNGEGLFELTHVGPGSYTVVVEAVGFKMFSTKIKLDEGEEVSLDVTLEVGYMGGAAFLPGGSAPNKPTAE
jgi:hypothetical protein